VKTTFCETKKMNEVERKLSWRIGTVAMGLIPVLQLCFLAYYGWFLHQNGFEPIEVMSRPPMSVFVWHPAMAIAGAVCVAGWTTLVAFRKPTLVHATTYQVIVVLMAFHLTYVVHQTTGFAVRFLKIREQTEQHSQNPTSEGIRQPADGSPKPSM
jgi:hypothetical protein